MKCNQINNLTIAALVRGLYIDHANRPQIVIYESACQNDVPTHALTVNIGVSDDEKIMAEKIRTAYTKWKEVKSNSNTPANNEAILLPSCAAVCCNGKTEAFYWIDDDLDSARQRLTMRNDTPRLTIPAAKGQTITAVERAQVVHNRVTIVTGGAQGIGEEIVRNLTAAGALVFIADLNLDGAQKLAAEINAAEKRTAAIGLAVNVSDEASVQAMFNTVAQTTGGFDLCISNAGVLKAGSVLEQNIDDFKFVTDINYTGFFVISKFAGRLLRTQHFTAPHWKTDIIQVNSKSGLEGSNKNGAYAGGKFGSLGLVASFALELIEYNIKVNAVCPGNFLDGPLWSHPEKGLFVQYLNTGKVPGAKTLADVRAFYESKVPMKRGCTGVDLMRAIYYIVEQQYETGQAVPITGGQVMLH